MIKFKKLIIERKFDDDLDELTKNLNIIAVLGKGIGKIVADINLQTYENLDSIEVERIEKVKEILRGLEKTIQDSNKLINKEGNNDQERREDTREEEIDTGRDFNFTSPERKLPANI